MKIEINNSYKGDCIELMKFLPDESVDVICTDPPYLYLKNQKLDRPFDELEYFKQVRRVLKPDGFIILFGRGTSFYRWNTILADLGFTFKEEIIWDKLQMSSPMNSISRRHETISFHTKGNGRINKVKIDFIEANKHEPHKIQEAICRLTTTFGNRKTFDLVKKYYEYGEYEYNEVKDRKFNATLQTDIKATNGTLRAAITLEEGVRERSIIKQVRDHYTAIHPTQKPHRLLERLLALVCKVEPNKPKPLVLDTFRGSGSTDIACINSGCDYISFEIDDEFFDKANIRVENYKKQFQPNLFGYGK